MLTHYFNASISFRYIRNFARRVVNALVIIALLLSGLPVHRAPAGVNTYSYDYANRLVSICNQQSTILNHYNGLGDRYRQTVDGETITFTLDLAAFLSQVLADGENTYLYGLGRIAQESEDGKDYLLPDALGSVRQIAGQDGSIDLAQSFDPFGNLRTRRAGGETLHS
jgi:hypothetical protein